jgi:hypothetical protein
MELTKFVIIIILAVFSIIGSILMLIKYNADKRKELDNALTVLRTHTDEEDRKLGEKIDRMYAEILSKLTALEQCQSKLQVQGDLWWDFVRHNVLDTLKTFPTLPNEDTWIEDLKNDKISLEDAKLLKEAFLYKMKLPDNKNEQWAYSQAIQLLNITIHKLREESVKNELSRDGEE